MKKILIITALIANTIFAQVTSIAESSDSSIYFGTYKDGLYQYKNGEVKKIDIFSDNSVFIMPFNKFKNQISSILVDSKDNLWIGTRGDGLFLYAKDSTKKHFHPLNSHIPEEHVNDISEDDQGRIVVSTEYSGIGIYDLKTDKWISYFHDPSDKLSLPHNKIISVVKDMYFGSWGRGLISYMDSSIFMYHTVLHDYDYSIQSNYISDICIVNDGLLVASWGGGLDFFDSETQKFNHLFPQNDEKENVFKVFMDSAGNIYISVFGKGMYILSDIDEGWAFFDSHSMIWEFFETMSGDMFIGTQDGLYRFDGSEFQNIFTLITH